MSFLDYPGSLLAPAVNWARQRLDTGSISHAEISGSYLWLMDQSGLSQISLQLPLASKHFPVKGMFLGQSDNHAWVLNEDGLHHVDGLRGETRFHTVETLGGSREGIVEGGRVYLRGNRGVAVFNAISGKRISSASWDQNLTQYLANFPGKNPGMKSTFSWPGIIKQIRPGFPSYCYPGGNEIAHGKLYTVFRGTRVVALSDKN